MQESNALDLALLAAFNQIKSIAFGLDKLFKEDKQDAVKFHHTDAAISLTINSLVNNWGAFRTFRCSA